MKRRAIFLLLVCVLAWGILSVPAFAADSGSYFDKTGLSYNAELTDDFTGDYAAFQNAWASPEGYAETSMVADGVLSTSWVQGCAAVLAQETELATYEFDIMCQEARLQNGFGLRTPINNKLYSATQDTFDQAFGIGFAIQAPGEITISVNNGTTINSAYYTVSLPNRENMSTEYAHITLVDQGAYIALWVNDAAVAAIAFDETEGDLYQSGRVYDADGNQIGEDFHIAVPKTSHLTFYGRMGHTLVKNLKISYNEAVPRNVAAFKTDKTYAFHNLVKFELEQAPQTNALPASVLNAALGTSYSGQVSLETLQADGYNTLADATGIVLAAQAGLPLTQADVELYQARYALYDEIVYGNNDFDFSDFVSPGAERYGALEPTDPTQRLVGVAYTTWFQRNVWAENWYTPLLGSYASVGNPAVLKQHATWLADAGVDFVFVDWSNDVDYDFEAKVDGTGRARPDFETIEQGTIEMFDVWGQMEAAPKIAIFIGFPDSKEAATDGRLQRKADQVYRYFIENEANRKQYQYYDGKPLLIVYGGTPRHFSNPYNVWDDDRFTVRYMTGWVTSQDLYDSNYESIYGYWSWEERGSQSYTVYNNQAEAMTVTSSWRGEDSFGNKGEREMGKTFLKTWARAHAVGPNIVLVPTFNEWGKGEQPSPEQDKDIEPTVEDGTFYLDILKEQIKKFKATDPTLESFSQEAKDVLSGALAMQIGKATARQSGKSTFIDPANTEVMPLIIADRTMVPARFIAEGFHAKVDWDAAAQMVTITQGDNKIRLWIGELFMEVNGEVVDLDAGPQIVNDRTLVPLRAIAEALNKTVYWNPKGLILIGSDKVLQTTDAVADEIIAGM